jgi:transposase
MPHLTPIQRARAIAKLEENWSLAAVARELHCSKTCILNMKRRWQENRLERPIRIGVGKVSLLKFIFTLIMY